MLSKDNNKKYNISILRDLFFLILQNDNIEKRVKNWEKLTL